jgi:hypothetical protein
MLSNLSDLLMSRVDPDPAKSQTSMVAMSPQSQAQAMQQQPAVQAPAPAQFLNAATQGKPGKTPQNVLDWLKKMDNNEFAEDTETATEAVQGGKPTKKLNLSGVKVTTADLEEDAGNPYQSVLKGKYGTKWVSGNQYETEEDSYRRMLMRMGVKGEKLDKALYMKERMMDYKYNKLPDSLTIKEKEQKLTDYYNQISKEGPVAW